MKLIQYISILVFLLFANLLPAQDTNKIAKDPKNGDDMFVGAVTREGLTSLSTWFNEEYNIYTPDSTAIEFLKTNREKLPYLFLVMGTWCGDSKEHVPHFYKIADLINYPEEKIFVVAVDRDKKGGDFCLSDFDITLVPTFIFTSKGNEIGRIIETPVVSLEQDMVDIIKGVK